LKKDENGNMQEPYEEIIIDVDDAYSGTVIDKMNQRKAEMTDMRPSGARQDAHQVPCALARPDRLPVPNS
jgi:predicted membrane GTPase involved in stress response